MFPVGLKSRGLRFVVSAFLLVVIPSVTLAADATYDKAFSNRNATGEELANAFFDLLSHTGSPTGTVGTTAEQNEASKALVKPYLDSAFLVQRASGQRYTADSYIPADVDEFEVGDVRETRPSDGILVVRYSVRTDQTLPDAALVMSAVKAPRLTVFHWNDVDNRWKILSHANFNTPVAAICDKEAIADNDLKSPASLEDHELGISLTKKWYALLEQGDGRPIMHPQIQGQTATGAGYTTPTDYKPRFFSKVEIDHFVVTRNDKLVVVSLFAKAGQTVTVSGSTQSLTGNATPRLLTFLESDDGKWSLIASAFYNPPEELPEGVACVPSGILERAQ